MKECSKCGNILEEDNFYKDKSKSSGLTSHCKLCLNKARRDFYLLNRESKIQSSSDYYKENKEKVKKRRSFYYKKNKERLILKQKSYYRKNKKKINNYSKEYRIKRKDKDKLFKLRTNISSLIRAVIKNKGFKKNSKTSDILGCSYEFFMEHLNNNPYGLVFGEDNIDLDHIIPISTANNIEEVLKLSHFSNFQLLPSYYNRYIKKNEKFNKKDFEEWLSHSYYYQE